MKTKILLFVSLLSIAFFNGCTTSEKVDVSATSNTIIIDDVVANTEIDATVEDVSIIAEDQFYMQSSPSAKANSPRVSMLPACATVTIDLTNDTYTRTVDFGTQGCALSNGNIVKGKIIIKFSKNFATAIKTISYTLDRFYHNGKLIEGSKTITHELKTTDLLAVNHPVTTHLIDIKITFPDGKVYSRIGKRVREMVEGMTTIANWEDNVYLVLGYNITIFPNGTKYTFTIKTPLRFNMGCRKPFPVKGVVEIIKNDGKAILEYGNGECDDLATITVNGVAKEIHLKKQ